MSDPKKQHVIGKKPIVAERTLTERSFCEIDQYYYSEMFTCPICYGRDTERERIINLLESKLCPCVESDSFPSPDSEREDIMKHMNCSWDAMMIEYHVALIKGEQK